MRIKHSRFFVFMVSAIAALGGLLFGYDTGVISGAILFIKKDFILNTFSESMIISAVLIGALIGAFCSGAVTDYFGRRKVIISTSLIFIIGSLVSAFASSIGILIIGRLGLGIAIGIASFTAPLYIAEVSPSQYRGALVSLNQLMITIGIVFSYLIDYKFAEVSHTWRWMLGMGLLPALVLLIGMFFLPESPRWLIFKGYLDKATHILKNIRLPHEVDQEILEIKQNVAAEKKARFTELFHKWLRPALLIGLGLAFLQQATGINTIIYYAPTILQMACISSSEHAILNTIIIGFFNVFFTLIGILLIDKIGRRPLLIIGQAGMGIALFSISFAFHYNTQSTFIQHIAFYGMLLYIASFAASLGMVVWLIIAEIFPLNIRGLGMSITTSLLWFFNFAVSFTFLPLVQHLGEVGTFSSYGIICILGILFVYYYVPETKGISLENIENNLRKNKRARDLGVNH